MARWRKQLIGGRYRLEQRLGRGGMGSVYRAYDTSGKRTVALKLLERQKTADSHARGELRFRREFATLTSHRHPRIVEVFSFDVDPEGAFYTMELIDGEDLRHVRGLSIESAVRILADVASALSFLHNRGLVHRDVAPRNVRCTSDGRAKLFDFGVVVDAGYAGDLAGTPGYVPPEALHGLPLDGRSDLFGFGVLAYFALTHQLPYPCGTFQEQLDAMRTAPPRLSAARPDIPEALEELIGECLRLDPLARPSSAAEVIERLGAIAPLSDTISRYEARGYLHTAALVGREQEVEQARRFARAAAQGHGATLFIEAETGAGKSRLLREIALEAQLGGFVVATTSAELATPRAFGVLADLLSALIAIRPQLVRPLMEARADELFRVLPLAGRSARARPAVDPAEERMRVLSAILDVILELSRSVPVALLVDDMQRADEASATALAALARSSNEAALLIVVSRRRGESVRAPAAVEALLEAASQQLALRGFDTETIERLIESTFGRLPHEKRLAAFLYERTGGSPLFCTELLRHLVDTDVLRYDEGQWILESELELEALPSGLAQTIETRLGQLDPATRRIAEVLAIVGGELSLELCVALADAGEAEVFAALEELSRQGTLVGDGAHYRFRHDAWREALLAGLDDEQKRALHRRVGEYFLDAGGEHRRRAGVHLYSAGDDARSAPLLEEVGTELYEAQALADCLPPLESAYEALKRVGAPVTRTMHIQMMLLSAGWVVDHRVGACYAEPALLAYSRHAGLALAARIRPLVGKYLALSVGVTIAFFRWLLTGTRGPNPLGALTTFAITLGYACAVANARNRLSELEALVSLSEPLGIFKKRVPYATYLAAHAFPQILLGHLGDAEEGLTTCIDIIQNDHLTPATETQRRFAETATRGLRALVDVNQFEPRLEDDLARLDAAGFRYYQLVADTTRVVKFRYRGEEAQAVALEEAIETRNLELGSWSTDVQALLFGHPAYALCNDVLGLKRSLAQLEHWSREGFSFEARIAITSAEYQRARGCPERGIEPLSKLCSELLDRDALMQQWVRSALAECLFAAGELGRAREQAEEVLRRGDEPGRRILLPWLRVHRVLALCLAEAGELEQAVEVVERALRLAEERDIPPLAGALHVARARIARSMNDGLAFEVSRARASDWLKPTGNSSLLRYLDQLSDSWSAAAGEVAEQSSSTSSEVVTQVAGKSGSH